MYKIYYKTPATGYVLPSLEFETKKEAKQYLNTIKDEHRKGAPRGHLRMYARLLGDTLYVKSGSHDRGCHGDDRSYQIFKVEK